MIGWANTAAQAEPARGSRSQPKGAEEARGGAEPARHDSHALNRVGHHTNVRAFIRTPYGVGGWAYGGADRMCSRPARRSVPN